MRSAVFNTPEAIAHLLELAALRAPAAHRTRHFPAGLVGRVADGAFQPVPGAATLFRYSRALEASPLCDLVTVDYLDYLVSVVRERVGDGTWGQAGFPVGGKGAGYGRQRGAYPSMDPDTIELAVADLVEQLSGTKHPNLAPDKVLRSKVRQYRRRLRQLAVS